MIAGVPRARIVGTVVTERRSGLGRRYLTIARSGTDSNPSGSTWDSYFIIQQQTAHRHGHDSALGETVGAWDGASTEEAMIPQPPHNTPNPDVEAETDQRPEFETHVGSIKSFLSNIDMSNVSMLRPDDYIPESSPEQSPRPAGLNAMAKEFQPRPRSPPSPVSSGNASPIPKRLERKQAESQPLSQPLSDYFNSSIFHSNADLSPEVEATGALRRITTAEREKRKHGNEKIETRPRRRRSHSIPASMDATMATAKSSLLYITSEQPKGTKRGRETAEFSTGGSDELNRALLSSHKSSPPLTSPSPSPQSAPPASRTRSRTSSCAAPSCAGAGPASPSLRRPVRRPRKLAKFKRSPAKCHFPPPGN